MVATQDSYGQNNTPNGNPATVSSPVKSDSVSIQKREQGFSGVFKKIFGKHSDKALKDTVAKKKGKNDTSHIAVKPPHPPLLKFTQGGVTYTTLYTQGVNLNTGVNGMYNLAHVFQDFNVAGVPLMAEATGVMNNGQYIKDYSSYSIGFDSRTFLDALEKRAQNAELNKLATEKSHLPPGQHMNLSDSMKAFDSIRTKLTSPNYQSEISTYENRLKKMEDSISKSEDKQLEKTAKKDTSAIDKDIKDSVKKDEKQHKPSDTLSKSSKQDSVTKAPNLKQDSLARKMKADTTELHNLRQKIALYEKLEKRYEQLFELKKNYSKLAQADSAEKNQESKYNKDRSSLNNPDNAIKSLEENKMISPYEKFLSGFQYIDIGRSTEEMSDFTLHNFMMNGVAVGYKTTNDMYLSGAYGKEQAVIDPYLLTGVITPTYNRTVEYGSVGVGSPKESNLYATVINISDPGSLSSLSEANWILDVSKKIVLFKNFDITGEIAHSYFTYVKSASKLDSALLPSASSGTSDLAYAIKLHGIIPGLNTDVKAEFLNTGANYVTLGNQFLLSGTSTYRTTFKQKLSKKLSVELGGAHVVQNQNNLTGTQGTDNWLEAGIKYKPINAVDLEFNYSPRQFQQQQGAVIANSLTSNINQVSGTGNIRYELLGRSMNTTLFVGNFQFNTPDNTTYLVQNINTSYYMFNQIIMLTNISSLNFTGNESRNGWTGNVSQFIGQGVYSMSIGKTFMFSSGLQWVEQPGIISNGAGLIGSIGKSFKKWGKLSIQLNSRNNIDDLFNFHTGQMIVSTNASILW